MPLITSYLFKSEQPSLVTTIGALTTSTWWLHITSWYIYVYIYIYVLVQLHLSEVRAHPGVSAPWYQHLNHHCTLHVQGYLFWRESPKAYCHKQNHPESCRMWHIPNASLLLFPSRRCLLLCFHLLNVHQKHSHKKQFKRPQETAPASIKNSVFRETNYNKNKTKQKQNKQKCPLDTDTNT